MGKKINPKIYRLNTIGETNSKWFSSKKTFASVLETDVRIRKYIQEKFKNSGIARVEIKRSSGNIEVIIHTSKPGVIIGRGGAGVEDIKEEIKRKFFGNKKINIVITISEVDKPDLNSELIFQNMAAQLEKRVPFRRVMKRAIEQVKRAGAKGVKVSIAGRLNGVEIARTEILGEGKIPTHTLRADIDYTRGKVRTIYGLLGVKVWIYKGDIFEKDKKEQISPKVTKKFRGGEKSNKTRKPVKKTVKKNKK